MITLLFLHGFAVSPKIWDIQIKEFSKDNEISLDPKEIEDLEDVLIIGWSMGALDAVKIFLKHKNKIKALVLVSAFPKFLKSKDYPYGLSPALLKNLEKKIRADFENGIEYFYDLIPAKISAQIPSKEKIFEDLERLKTEDIRHLLPKIDVPTLLIHGDCDQIVPLKSAEYMAENIRDSELVIFEGVGHAPFLERTKYFNQCVRNFINKK